MPVNSLHREYEAMLSAWSRARDVIAGEDAIKGSGERYLPRLEAQTEQDYSAYLGRTSFFNATGRTAEGYMGLIFRRQPFVKVPEGNTAIGKAMAEFTRDVDMLGTSLAAYAKHVLSEVVAVGRTGTLVDWESDGENRVYVANYAAENIINWRVERVDGRNVPTLVVLYEPNGVLVDGDNADEFEPRTREQIRVLRLEQAGGERRCVVEVWRPVAKAAAAVLPGPAGVQRQGAWEVVESLVPLRLGKPLPLLPFVFHGPRHSRPDVDKLPLSDLIAVNLDHYRLNAEFKHGLHFTALPTAWVSGFGKDAQLRIGSSTAWVTEQTGAAAGFLEFTGQGLTTFERAMDRDERLMALLGSRLLENNKKVGETAEAIELRQTGEHSILGGIALSVGQSMTEILRWAHWWNSTEESPEDVSTDQVIMELNTDFSVKGLAPQDIQALVAAWQAGAISRESMIDAFRRGEVLPEGRSVEEEEKLISRSGAQRLRVEG